MKGIEKQKKESFIIERYVPFGKFIINHYQLDKNILLVKYPKSIAPIPKLRRKIISEELKILLQNLLDTQLIDIDLQKQLKNDEITLFENLLNFLGLSKYLNYKRFDKNILDYVHRYEVLKGGLNAGNQSTELKQELTEILQLFINKNIIDSKEGYELIEILA
jgi:hypothetical protein